MNWASHWLPVSACAGLLLGGGCWWAGYRAGTMSVPLPAPVVCPVCPAPTICPQPNEPTALMPRGRVPSVGGGARY